MPKPFDAVTAATQVRRLRTVARAALPAWGLSDARVRLLLHGYNTTFRVDTEQGQRFALRINTQPHKTEAHLRAEVAWLAAVAAETTLRVPVPQPTVDGDLAARVPGPDGDRDLPAVLFSWLEGRNLGARPTVRQARELGVAMATLHRHAESFTLPVDADLPLFDRVLTDLPSRFADHPALDAEGRAVVLDGLDRAQALQDEAFAADRTIVLHADLHGGNLKWHAGRLSVFDFDDAGRGVPSLDLAIAAYYRRDDDAAEDAMRAGYASVRELPPVSPEAFEGMVAGRNLLLLNDVLGQPNASLRAMIADYLPLTVRRLRHWTRTGRFRRSVESD